MTDYSTTVGIDLGDKMSYLCVLDDEGEIVEEAALRTTRKGVSLRFKSMEPCRIAMETGTHSRWVSHLLEGLGHEVIVADARRLRMIFDNENKSDKLDAQTLARVARFDPRLFTHVQHRQHETQVDLEHLKAREALVNERKRLITHIRSVVKTFGHALPSCDTDYFTKRTLEHVPDELRAVLSVLYEVLEVLDEKIRHYNQCIEELCEKYSETLLLREVGGVGPITALAYCLTIEDPHRFPRSRIVGSYLGLRPRLDQSGEHNPQLGITKCGNSMVRRLLVQAAHYILGPFGAECELREFGLRIAAQGGKRAKKRAAVAVARKLAVLLHRLWVNGEVYDPWYNTPARRETP